MQQILPNNSEDVCLGEVMRLLRHLSGMVFSVEMLKEERIVLKTAFTNL